MKNLTIEEIELAVAKHFRYRTNIIVPNISWGMELHECDILVLRPSGYLVEVEIKRSKSNLLSDAKKPHGHVDRKNRIKELWFAVPQSLVEVAVENLQSECGIISVYRTKWGWIKTDIIRQAKPRRKARKLNEKERWQMMRLGCIRVWSLKQKMVGQQKKK